MQGGEYTHIASTRDLRAVGGRMCLFGRVVQSVYVSGVENDELRLDSEREGFSSSRPQVENE